MTALNDGPVTALEKLAAELDGPTFEAQVVTGHGQPPFLHVRNRDASMLNEDIYAVRDWFWFGWAECIAPLDDVAAAAHRIAYVLHADGEPSGPDASPTLMSGDGPPRDQINRADALGEQ
jgi:hypothetical protein